MKILMIGGTGLISTNVTTYLVKKNHDVTLINRGHNNNAVPKGVKTLTGDINDTDTINTLLQDKTYDVVVDWIAFGVADCKRDINLFKEITTQYVFISSASAYKKPIERYPIKENHPLENEFWDYAQNKKLCEEYLMNQTTDTFHVTIVRPAHTYNSTSIVGPLPCWSHPYTHIDRIINDKPMVVSGDGRSLWSLTHSKDFAYYFEALLGNKSAYDTDFHITSETLYTWDDITMILGKALQKDVEIVHAPSDLIIHYLPEVKGPLIGDQQYSLVFDQSKLYKIVDKLEKTIRLEDVIDEIVTHYKDNPSLQTIDEKFSSSVDEIVQAMKGLS